MGRPAALFKRIVAAALAAAYLAAPLPAQEAEGDREADLLGQLAQAETPQAASLIEAELRDLWSRSGSPSIDLLVQRGQDAIAAGDPKAAIEHFTAAIDHDPAFAEGYVGRAMALYLTGRVGPAIDDLRQALVLNPNQFEALRGFAVILEELGRPEDALEVWRRVADMNPQNAEAAAAADRLALSLEGRTL